MSNLMGMDLPTLSRRGAKMEKRGEDTHREKLEWERNHIKRNILWERECSARYLRLLRERGENHHSIASETARWWNRLWDIELELFGEVRTTSRTYPD